jgi:hypothetical protein
MPGRSRQMMEDSRFRPCGGGDGSGGWGRRGDKEADDGDRIWPKVELMGSRTRVSQRPPSCFGSQRRQPADFLSYFTFESPLPRPVLGGKYARRSFRVSMLPRSTNSNCVCVNARHESARDGVCNSETWNTRIGRAGHERIKASDVQWCIISSTERPGRGLQLRSPERGASSGFLVRCEVAGDIEARETVKRSGVCDETELG